MKQLSLIISYLFHPVFHFLYFFTALFFLSEEFLPFKHTYNTTLVLLYVVLNTVLIPIILVYFMQKDFQLYDKADRKRPLFMGGVIYLIVYFFFQRFLFPDILLNYLLGISIGLFLLLALNNNIKISLHTSGMGAAIAIALSLFIYNPDRYTVYLITVILIAGLVGSSRLFLKAHEPKEVYLGYLTGFGTTGIIVILTQLFLP